MKFDLVIIIGDEGILFDFWYSLISFAVSFFIHNSHSQFMIIKL